jgi:hypothetical protein
MRSYQPVSKVNIFPTKAATMEHNFKKKPTTTMQTNPYLIPQNQNSGRKMNS